MQLLQQRAAANQTAFYVYKDGDSGFNHGTASGVFFSKDVTPSTIGLDGSCVDAGTSIGCSTSSSSLDRVRGTVFRVSFPPLKSQSYAGVNFQEPSNYVPNDGSLGYNLSPATTVQFDVRSTGNVQVQFGVGGCVTGFYTIGTSWQSLSIPINTMYPPPGGAAKSCPPDLTNTHILFTIGTNGAKQAAASTILMDNIQFTPVPSRQATAPSLPLSTATFGVVPSSAKPYSTDQSNRNVAAIYESALAALTLFSRGQPADIASALGIADAFDYALAHDNEGDPVPPSAKGNALHSAYSSGDLALLNAQPKTGTAMAASAGAVRLGGFSGGADCGTTKFCLVLDGATGGNNAWAIFALVAAYQQSGNPKYLADAESIGNWIIDKLQRNNSPYPGYLVGYNDGGVQQPILGQSTENNGDIWAAFTMLGQIEASRGNAATATAWRAAAKVASDFVLSMQITGGGFYVGTVTAADARVSGNGPGNGNCAAVPAVGVPDSTRVLNSCEFIDSDTFTILPMAAAGFTAVDWGLALSHVLTYSASSQTYAQNNVTAGALTVSGFNLVPAAPGSGVAFEFTGQMSVNCSYLGTLLNNSTFTKCGTDYLTQIRNAQSSAPFGDGFGVVAAVLPNGGTLAPSSQCLGTPFQCIPERVGIAATSWAALSEQKFNPMAFGAPVLSSSQLSFPKQLVGTNATMAVTLTSVGIVPLKIQTISISGANASDFTTSGTCAGATVPTGGTCTLNVIFTPTGSDAEAATLQVPTDGLGTSVSLSGVAQPVNDFSLSVPASSAVVAGASATLSVGAAVTRGTALPATLSVSGLPAGATASFTPGTITSGGAAASLKLSFATSTAPGTYMVTVTGTSGSVLRTATSRLTVNPAIGTSLTGLSFGTQTIGNTGALQQILITNNTTGPMPFTLAMVGRNSAEFPMTSNCISPLAASANCQASVTFNPSGTGPRLASFLVQSIIAPAQQIPLAGTGVGSCAAITDCALSAITERVTENSNAFYVYRDMDSGQNHGTPSGLFGSISDLSTVLINAGCIDSQTDPSGCSSDPNAMDVSRGTVFAITFPKLTGLQYVGVNFIEPANYNESLVPQPANGYDLSHATMVAFDVRAPQGGLIRFNVGACNTPRYAVTAQWQHIALPVAIDRPRLRRPLHQVGPGAFLCALRRHGRTPIRQ